ncbi:uncharacterized protein PHACADRAFT_255591 [Phanerochaete carnosa HHB-10118-sp]|uniref:DUF6534 domain-containing protein n=1 Tax=Phanerochaete carnosa (strain HHB-10118-sp) TaxID=650164 RepID=K5VUF3_PHACS|nr:uncharacterized protein PHACADRAFT_255591 [Phanerochaete carnosa HHB-10118-sp]EKM55163.1 hypothetical protein PHACADRAFT_255591 [Phanerochaete carnosa HHB-10118-sp]
MQYDSTLGAALIGGFVAAMSYGIMSLQTYNFFQQYGQGATVLKHIIRTLWAMHTLHFAFVAQGVYTVLVTDFSNIAAITTSPWSIGAASFVNAIMTMTVHCSYCHRVWKLSNNSRFPIIPLVCMAIATFAFSLSSDIKLLILPSFSSYKSTEWLLFAALVCGCSTDLCIALWLCWWLLRQRKGLSGQTHSMVNTIIVYTVATGLITSVVALAELITGAALPDTYIFIGIDFFRGGIYTNSWMASLNARDRFRRDIRPQATVITSVHFANDTTTMSSASAPTESQERAPPGIVIEKIEV